LRTKLQSRQLRVWMMAKPDDAFTAQMFEALN
jgi:hypothetical protein